MDKVFEFVQSLGLNMAQRDRIAEIHAMTAECGNLEVFDLIVEALPEVSVVLIEKFETWVDSVIEAEADYYQAVYEYEIGSGPFYA